MRELFYPSSTEGLLNGMSYAVTKTDKRNVSHRVNKKVSKVSKIKYSSFLKYLLKK